MLGKLLKNLVIYAGAATLIVMMLNIGLDVLFRNTINSPIQGTYELVIYWYMVIITAVGIWAAQRKDDHITVTLITERLDEQSGLIHGIFTRAVSVIFLVIFSWYGMVMAIDRTRAGEYVGSNEILIWPMRFLLPIAFFAYAMLLFMDIVRALQGRGLRNDSIVAAETEIL